MTITAKVIADSVASNSGVRITTLELEYPRFIHSEFMTHRVFSRNAQSSRAVPVSKTAEANQDFVEPLVWGKNKSGMSSEGVLEGDDQLKAQLWWATAAKLAFKISKILSDLGLHKQWSNRITEPFSKIKVVVTSTEWENFFWLRNDPEAAQPEFVKLAQEIEAAINKSQPVILKAGEWHAPYVVWYPSAEGKQVFYDENGEELDVETALNISASCCAQVSYRALNSTKEKALEIYAKLFSGAKEHLSPVEHQAAVMSSPKYDGVGKPYFEVGATALDKKGNFWGGNFKGWVQYRQVLAFIKENPNLQ